MWSGVALIGFAGSRMRLTGVVLGADSRNVTKQGVERCSNATILANSVQLGIAL